MLLLALLAQIMEVALVSQQVESLWALRQVRPCSWIEWTVFYLVLIGLWQVLKWLWAILHFVGALLSGQWLPSGASWDTSRAARVASLLPSRRARKEKDEAMGVHERLWREATLQVSEEESSSVEEVGQMKANPATARQRKSSATKLEGSMIGLLR